MTQERRPWIAALANLIAPGLGFLYAGAVRAAIAWPVVLLALVAVVIAIVLWFPLPLVGIGALAVAVLVPIVLGPILGWRAARRAGAGFQPTKWNRIWVYVLFAVVVITLSDLGGDLVRRHMLEAYRNPSGAMDPTLLADDFLLVDKRGSPEPQRGRIAVFQSVEDSGLKVLKRIVAVGGDTIAARNDSVLVNGKHVMPAYHVSGEVAADTFNLRVVADLRERLAPRDTSTWDLARWGPMVVPAGHFFVLGDNVNASYDSRYHGPVPNHQLIGWPLWVYFSRDSTGIRWSRIGRALR